jgi:hypothetical protein
MKYYILDESMYLVLKNGESISLSKTHPYFDKIKENLLLKNFNAVSELLIKPNLNKLNLTVKNGSYFFKDIKIPNFISDQINGDDILGKSLLNFWLNMRYKHDEELIYKICQELIRRSFFPLSEDGFIIGYDEADVSYSKKTLLNNNETNREVFFYNIHSLPKLFHEIIKGKNFEYLVKKLFHTDSKKAYNILRSACFKKESNHINYQPLLLSFCFENILNENNLIKFLENIPEHDLPLASCHSLNNFLKEISLEKRQESYNQKKILNFLSTVDWERMPIFVNLYEKFKYNVRVNINSLELKNDFNIIFDYLDKECQKFGKEVVKNLNIDRNFPSFYKLHKTEFEDYIIHFPKTNQELTEWSSLMGNCIKTFSDSISNGSTVVFALINKYDNALEYNVEVCSGRIKQIERRRKTQVSPALRINLTEFLYSLGLVYSN